MTFLTTDLSDAHPEAQTCDPIFCDYGARTEFHGRIKTVRVFEDNALVRATLETPGEGRVLVVDGAGSIRCALVGGNLGLLAVENGWVGIVVHGLIRDSVEISQQNFGLKAMGTHPRKSKKGSNPCEEDVVLEFAGVTFKPGAWLYADADGILVSDQAIHA